MESSEGKRGRRRKQLLDYLNVSERILEVDRGSTRSLCMENSLWKRLWACRRTDCTMNTVRVNRNSITLVVLTRKLSNRQYLENEVLEGGRDGMQRREPA